MPMPLLSLNAQGDDVTGPDGRDGTGPLAAALAALPPGRPVIVMVHGYRYAPAQQRRSPHRLILSAEPAAGRRAMAWPRRLGCVRPGGDELGLAIGFGWEARGTIWGAYDAAGRAGAALARLVTRIRSRHDGPVGVIAHSLGARVALSSLAAIDSPGIDRMVLLAAAEFRDAARLARRTPAGRGTEVVNVTSRENALYDTLLERLFLRRPGASLGHRGLDDARWCDLPLHDPATLSALRAMGYPVAAPAVRLCHSNLYLRAGVFGLYRDLLRDRNTLPLARLRAMRPPSSPVRPRGVGMGLSSPENASP